MRQNFKRWLKGLMGSPSNNQPNAEETQMSNQAENLSQVDAVQEKIAAQEKIDAAQEAEIRDFGLLGKIAPFRTAEEKLNYAKVVIGETKLPTNFSVTLGVAPCNHSCIFCPQSVQKPEKAGWLDMDILRKALSEMPEENLMLNISSYSETLSAPNLVPAIKLMKQVRPKLPIVMATNGSLFKEDKIRELMDEGLDHYSYSFDAPTRQAYEKMMQVDHFDRVWRNLERICEIREEKKSKMKITSHILGFQELKEDFKKFREHWMKKIDGVAFRPVGNWGGDNWNLKQQWEKAGFTPIHQAPEKRYPCGSIFMHFKLQWTGQYAPCVASVPDYVPEKENHRVPYLGHVRDITFIEAWERLSAMRRAHLEGKWDKYEACKTCNIWSLFGDMWEEKVNERENSRQFVIEGVDHIDKNWSA